MTAQIEQRSLIGCVRGGLRPSYSRTLCGSFWRRRSPVASPLDSTEIGMPRSSRFLCALLSVRHATIPEDSSELSLHLHTRAIKQSRGHTQYASSMGYSFHTRTLGTYAHNTPSTGIIDFPNLGLTYNGGWCSATKTR